MKMQLSGMNVNKVPKFLTLEHDVTIHSLQAHSTVVESNEFLIILLSLQGITSYFSVNKPTIEEWENESAYNHIDFDS